MNDPQLIITDRQWAKDLEDAYESYMWSLELHVAPDEDLKEQGIVPPSTLSGELFCGCSTCYTREQLFFLVPRIIKGFQEQKFVFIEEN